MSLQSSFILKSGLLSLISTFGTGLFPSVNIAQSILESNYGQSPLSSVYNNYFGIKADSSWKGNSVTFNTSEDDGLGNLRYESGIFRAYPNAFFGYIDRNNFLVTNSRYVSGGVFQAMTPEEQCQLLQGAKYATDSNYAKKLISLINKYNLKNYDYIQYILLLSLIVGIVICGVIAYKRKLIRFN